MRPLTFSLALLMLLALPGLAVADDAQNAKLEELWKTGSLWQVGDNIPKVEAARKEIVAAGDAGLAFIFTKLSSTDGLEYRCLEAVFKGFGAKALPGLLERMGHEDVKVRRNVAAMFGVIDDKSAAAKMVEHLKKESDLRCKVGHLQTLARWKEPTALDPLIECTRVTQDQEPLAERLKVRIVPLLGNYEDEKAIARLIELLEDAAFFVRDAARDALKGSAAGRKECVAWAIGQFYGDDRWPSDSNRLRLTVQVCAIVVSRDSRLALERYVKHPVAPVRAQAATCIANWMIERNKEYKKSIASATDTDRREALTFEFEKDGRHVLGALNDVLEKEDDPAVLAALERALSTVRENTAR